MAQEAAGGVVTPEGGLLRAWLDVVIHPKFATFQRWYPRMRFRWRAISFVVSLLFAFTAGLIFIARDAMASVHFSFRAFSPGIYRSYLLSPHGLFQWFCFWLGSIIAVFLVPAVAAAIGYRPIGSYRIRFRVAFGTLMQALPGACLFLLVGAIGNYFLGFLDSTSTLVWIASLLFAYVPIMTGLRLVVEASAAGSGRRIWQMYLMAALIYVLMCLLFWTIGGRIFVALGYPVY